MIVVSTFSTLLEREIQLLLLLMTAVGWKKCAIHSTMKIYMCVTRANKSEIVLLGNFLMTLNGKTKLDQVKVSCAIMGVFGFSRTLWPLFYLSSSFFFAAETPSPVNPMTTAAGSRATETFASPLFGR